MNCPKCESDISDSYESDDPSVGICGGWFCDACDLTIGDDERSGAFDDDADIMPKPRAPSETIGTPASEISGRPGHEGFGEFCRIAKSWGHD